MCPNYRPSKRQAKIPTGRPRNFHKCFNPVCPTTQRSFEKNGVELTLLHKYMSDYDAKAPSTFIKYLDANNLYGWAMCLPLPTGNFKWMDEHELGAWRSKPCILEVDMEYPEELHDLHNDYPLAPESLIINKCQKLVPNLRNKTKYVVHHENLKLYERLGMKIT